MNFISLKDAQDERVKKLYASYADTFPADERRDENQFQQLFHHPSVQMTGICKEQDFIGYAILWKLAGFSFLEHFEVFENYRNQHLGSLILQRITSDHPKLILETEPANLSQQASRRIGFYERNGFHILKENYRQPAYAAEKNEIPLYLMANYDPDDLECVIKNIFEMVYGK